MLSQLKASYQRVEQSLQRLTDSIAAYNPSTVAADELLAADHEVDHDLEQLLEHQKNHLQIEELNRITKANDEALKEQYRQIVELRKELASLQSYDPLEDSTEINAKDLLAYAKYISRTTVPPTFRRQDLSQKIHTTVPANTQNTNGVGTPSGGIQHGEVETRGANGLAGDQTADGEEKTATTIERHTPFSFEPWPSADIIERGALGSIQRMMDRGEDPTAVLSPEEQAEADRKRRQEEERERLEQEEREKRRMSMIDIGRGRTAAQDDVFDPDA